ncbi:MAG: hypothetical protein LBQ54_15700 [Planctomycetaceae bacterium]|jgi:hypothetical protein|nr:hypothetical protein [Planctomycetaceae bacterium]
MKAIPCSSLPGITLIFLAMMFGCQKTTAENPSLPQTLAKAETVSAESVPSGCPSSPQLTECSDRLKTEYPKEERLLYNLDRLLKEDLAAQSDEYKAAARAIVLHVAREFNPDADSILVKKYTEKEANRESKNLYWVIAGYTDSEYHGRGGSGGAEETTIFRFLVINNGKIIHINTEGMLGTCGGLWSDCCAGSSWTPNGDETFFNNFITLGLVDDFPFPSLVKDADKCLKMLVDRNIKTSFTHISLSGTSVTDEGLQSLAGLTQLTDIQLGTNPGLDNRRVCNGSGFRYLHSLKNLRQIIFVSSSGQIAGEFFEALPHFPQMERLRLSNVGRISRRQMEQVAMCKKLKFLFLEGLHLEQPDVFEGLTAMPLLEMLDIIGGAKDVPDTLDGKTILLHDLPVLRSLHFTVRSQAKNGTLVLENMPNLSSLSTDKSVDGDLFSENRLISLEGLTCSGKRFTENHFRQLSEYPNLRMWTIVDLDEKAIDRIGELHPAPAHVGSLYFGFTEDAAKAVAGKTLNFPVWPALTSLWIDFPVETNAVLKIPDMPSLNRYHVNNISAE